tara:strand:+ start:5834 stop:7822 length:1989 start_codon:yes stop_codon:yes gene_type:complete
MFNKVLIANRGEIACRIIRTVKRLGVRTVAVYSDADAGALHTTLADEAVHIGGAAASDSYLRADTMIAAALNAGAEAIHPGYGFLAENANFADACAEAGVKFIGPPASAIRAMGSKSEAKALMDAAGVPIVPGYHGDAQDDQTLISEAERVGYPLLVKASAGGGGKGMRVVRSAEELLDAIASARREAQSSFGDDKLLLERFLERGRHVEIQIFFDGHGHGVHLFERDCSVQRRYQKVIEEAPAPLLSDAMRTSMYEAALKAGAAVDYEGAGTVELIVGRDEFFFMEMNTRLQVEHPVTELITGVDLVEWQLRVAAGEALPVKQEEIRVTGHAVEARVYAEDPARGFLPAIGTLQEVLFHNGEGVRVDTGVRAGDDISIHYDPMIAKVIAHAGDRNAAIGRLSHALAHSHIAGLTTNTSFLCALLDHTEFVAGGVDTGLLDRDGEALAQARPHPQAAIVAAAIWVLARRERSVAELSSYAGDPWANNDGWRMNHGYVEPITLVSADREHALYLACDRGQQMIGEADALQFAMATRLSAHRYSVRVGSHTYNCDASVSPEEVSVLIDGHAAKFGVPDPLRTETDAGAHAGSLSAPMPGKILEVYVEGGETVAAGDALMLMEAMKMEHTIRAPHGGTVSGVNYAAGDQVDEGVELAVIDEGADG